MITKSSATSTKTLSCWSRSNELLPTNFALAWLLPKNTGRLAVRRRTRTLWVGDEGMSETLTHTARILKLLKANGQATNHELSRITPRYGARLHDIRSEGHDVLTERIKEGLFRYTYKGHRDDAKEAA